jgi:hypothetical protein
MRFPQRKKINGPLAPAGAAHMGVVALGCPYLLVRLKTDYEAIRHQTFVRPRVSNQKKREASSVFINGKWVPFSAIATPAAG